MGNPIHTPRTMLVTGGAGFIGCNYVRHVLAETDVRRVVVLDALTYAGSTENLDGLEAAHKERYRFVRGDICDIETVRRLMEEECFDTVVNFAAESHVDRSIDGPLVFARTNVLGTCVLLDAARWSWSGRNDVRFHHVSTDEVYGSLGHEGLFTESTPYDPSSPYSASKAASDHFVRAWHRTYGLPVTISNCSNNYGPYQFPEKLIPLMICKALEGKPLPVYGRGENVRDWLHVWDHCRAVECVLRRGRPGRTYNIGGLNELKNIDIVHGICRALDELAPCPDGKRERLITFVEDRPGHDLRYAIDASRITEELGWCPLETFASGLIKTIKWYLDNAEWLATIKREKYTLKRLGTASADTERSGRKHGFA